MTAADVAARVLALVPWLSERPGASLAEAAEVVGASPDVVRRELEMLCYCGGPGLGGGSMFDIDIVGDRITVHMAPGLQEPLRLSPADATRLVLSLTAVADVLGDQLPALRSALAKIRATAGLDEAVVSASVDADHRLRDLRTAIAQGRVVRLVYRGRRDDEARRRTLDPWHLEFTQDGWYLHAHDHDREDHRVFRVDRIQAVQVAIDEPVTTRRPDVLPSPRWEPVEDAVEVRLRLEGTARFIGDQVSLSEDHEVAGAREVAFATDSLPWATELIATGGGDVRVLAPDELAAMVRAHARDGLAAYDALAG
jgi:predicted DNA-binding transcriptional regulator YafY